jgi:hypothetical protein
MRIVLKQETRLYVLINLISPIPDEDGDEEFRND